MLFMDSRRGTARLRVCCALLSGALALIGAGRASAAESFWDVADLSEEQRGLYERAKSVLDGVDAVDDRFVALDSIERLISVQPGFLPAYIEKARFTILDGYVGPRSYADANRRALKILRRLMIQAPRFPTAWVLAGHAHTNLGELHQAKRVLAQAQRLTESDPWLYINWSTLLNKLGRNREAVDFAVRALRHTADNPKALVAAIVSIEQYGGAGERALELTSVIEGQFPDPRSRAIIASRLIANYGGRRRILETAASILRRQKATTPDLPECDLAIARLILARGFLNVRDGISRYRGQAVERAEQILLKVEDDPAVEDAVAELLVKLAISRDDHDLARARLDAARLRPVDPETISYLEAMRRFAIGDYEETIRIYEELATQDPAWLGSNLLPKAYRRLGDPSRLGAHYRRRVEHAPDSAWANGNYAQFLLLEMGNSAEAIRYGERALELMDYPMARSVTALAYRIESAKALRDERQSVALGLYQRSLRYAPLDAYDRENCGSFCATIARVAQLHADGVPASR